MFISGVKILNNDAYTSIMIRTKGIDTVQVDVKNKNIFTKIKFDNFFYERIKDLSEKEQIKEIVKYYLKHNKINSIEDNAHIDRYEGKFFAIEGTRNMAIQVVSSKLDETIIPTIVKKYILDRNKFLNLNNSIKNVSIGLSNKSSYKIIKDNLSNDSVYIDLYLKYKNNKKLLKFENEFIINYIKSKLESVDMKVQLKYSYDVSSSKDFEKLKFEDYMGLYIISDKFSIRIDDDLISSNNDIYDNIFNLVNEHNMNLTNAKKLELKMNDSE